MIQKFPGEIITVMFNSAVSSTMIKCYRWGNSRNCKDADNREQRQENVKPRKEKISKLTNHGVFNDMNA
jgi:hypothetical protein